MYIVLVLQDNMAYAHVQFIKSCIYDIDLILYEKYIAGGNKRHILNILTPHPHGPGIV